MHILGDLGDVISKGDCVIVRESCSNRAVNIEQVSYLKPRVFSEFDGRLRLKVDRVLSHEKRAILSKLAIER